MKTATPEQISSLRARLKDRQWCILPDYMPRQAQNLGRMYGTALKMKLGEVILPSFMIGEKGTTDALYVEGYDVDTMRKFCALARTNIFISAEGYHRDEKIYPLDWDSLKVGDVMESHFTTYYFAVGMDPTKLNEEGIDALGISVVVAFDIEPKHHPDCDGNCNKRHKITEEDDA